MEDKKIKSQKNAAVVLIIIGAIQIIFHLNKYDLDSFKTANFLYFGASVILIGIGFFSLKRSLKKQSDLKNK